MLLFLGLDKLARITHRYRPREAMRVFDFGKLPFDRLTQLDVVDDAQDKEQLDDLAEPLVILIVRRPRQA